jgi:hypothetical protein
MLVAIVMQLASLAALDQAQINRTQCLSMPCQCFVLATAVEFIAAQNRTTPARHMIAGFLC